MTWIFVFNIGANLLIFSGLAALGFSARNIAGSKPLRRAIRALSVAYWALLIGVTAEVTISSVLVLRSLGPASTNSATLSMSQYWLAAGVGILVWSTLRRLGPARIDNDLSSLSVDRQTSAHR